MDSLAGLWIVSSFTVNASCDPCEHEVKDKLRQFSLKRNLIEKLFIHYIVKKIEVLRKSFSGNNFGEIDLFVK